MAQAESFVNRELSWLQFAERVMAQVCNESLPLLERVKFAGIVGMLHDEFFMKRISGLKRQVKRGVKKLSLDGLVPEQELEACREELLIQTEHLSEAVAEALLPAMRDAGIPILGWAELDAEQQAHLRKYFRRSVQPILTPLAADAEHPFPFISNLGLNLAVVLPANGDGDRFVRIEVPGNRPRWIPLPGEAGFVPLEQVIAANLDLVFPKTPPTGTHFFRVTRGAQGEPNEAKKLTDELEEPGRIVELVSSELKARKFAGVVRLQVDPSMPKKLVKWLCRQLEIGKADVYPGRPMLALCDLTALEIDNRAELRYPQHRPATHPRLKGIGGGAAAIFDEIARGDILLHHPYHGFESSVLRMIQSAAYDPAVLAIKLTIYRTGVESPIIRALAEASRRGKQVAVLVEITARFDEAPNIAWGKFLEKEGVHVAYGVERLKTHVKLALVVREEAGGVRRYAHVGTGNYNVKTARLYEDVGILTCNDEICDDVAAVFNALTGAISDAHYAKMIVAPQEMRARFVELIRREAEHARNDRPSGIWAKMNQLQDPELIRELYEASRAGVSIRLYVRGLSCLQPGVPGQSENIRVTSVVGRFLEHSRVYRFENAGEPEHFIGSADWMKRNLDSRVETVTPLLDPTVKSQIDRIVEAYDADNISAWECGIDGRYEKRTPEPGEPTREVQQMLADRADGQKHLERVS